jgi:large subunit ribosomal protein L9
LARELNGRIGMKIILTQDFETLGLEGDIVDVARGYAKNYLIPKGFAVEASNSNVKVMEMRKGKIMANRTKDKEMAERVREEISQVTITIRQKAGEEGKLYGSVTSRDIAQELENEGIVVDRRKIVIDETIRALGEFEVPIKLHPEVTATIKVVVEGEEEEA